MIQNIVVLGAGSAGLLAAITIKKKLPGVMVTVARSSEIGVIGVGEGTTPAMPNHLFGFLGLSQARFYAQAEPTWKLGIRFIWGPRQYFNYTFDFQTDCQIQGLHRPNGYYLDDDCLNMSISSALMDAGKAFPRNPNAGDWPNMNIGFGFHIENLKLVATLHAIAQELGVTFVEGKVSGSERGPLGISSLQFEDGRKLVADFFVDCSGFRSELLGRTLGEPFVSFDRSLFCDRAVIGGWERTAEPILPYTIAETMDAGWAWQIEHEFHINRGYVYCSQAISDEAATEEFLRKNPKAPKSPRVVKFRSGRYRRMWVANVVAIGNSAGFVEPLEATALMAVTQQCKALVSLLDATAMAPTPTIRDVYNRLAGEAFDETRDFLSLHYKLNTRIDNKFWRHCREDTELGSLGPLLEFYRENGPNPYARYTLALQQGSSFGIEGWLAMLVGNRAPCQVSHRPTQTEIVALHAIRNAFRTQGNQGLTVAESLQRIRSPHWRWPA